MKLKRQNWKYLRVIVAHQTEKGSLRLTDIRLAKIPMDHRRIDLGSALFMALFERYKARGKQTVGIKEATRLIRVHDVTKALTRDNPKNIWDTPPYTTVV
jgi:hypothetical protein